MSQHDYVIANGTGAAVRSDLNNALAAIVSNNSGATEPATMYAYQWWADTTTGLLKLRNAANNAWITLRELDGTLTIEAGTVSAPGLAFASDLNTGVWSPGADQFAIATNGVERVEWGTSEVVFNDGGTNYDFRVEGDTNANLLFVDASADAVGIGTSSPRTLFNLASATGPALTIENTSTTVTGTGSYGSVDWYGNDATIGASGIRAQILASSRGSSGECALDFGTASTGTAIETRMRIDSTGNVGIGTTSPGHNLDLIGTTTSAFRIRSDATATRGFELWNNSSTNEAYISNYYGGPIIFQTTNTERARIDSSGRLLVGTSTARTNFYNSTGAPRVQVESTTSDGGSLSLTTNFTTATPSAAPNLLLARSGATTLGSNTLVAADNALGNINFLGSDGSEFVSAAQITAFVDGTPGANDMPGRIVLSTTADGASNPTERMRVSSDGRTYWVNADPVTGNNVGVLIGATADPLFHVSRNAATPFAINRKTNDGGLIDFLQDGAVEGSIAVSGTTVSYNGAHLSRWSQLSNGAERTEILRGSVLSNLDEMCEWGEEDNEQLNRMKVSDVEGDKNVSGVFQSWDDDDNTYINDFYCAMTGDFIIRIGAGVIVERGDLLMSAGDGTAKPQEDDIIRSKTIAKVTSTNVSCTYDDGSYCVPCVLMAC